MLILGFQLTIIFHIHICQCGSTIRGRCYVATTKRPVDKFISDYCCDHFEDINNTCIECKDGYTSSKGTRCEPCSNGHYGKRCADICKCIANQRCDRFKGCLDSTTTKDEGFYKDISTTQQIITESLIAKNDTSNWYTGIIEIRPIVIYIICAGLATTLVTITAAITIYRKKKQHETLNEFRRVNNEEQIQTENIETDHYLTVL